MKRKEGQDFEEYKKERKIQNEKLKWCLRGHIFFLGGTYRKPPKNNEIGKKG